MPLFPSSMQKGCYLFIFVLINRPIAVQQDEPEKSPASTPSRASCVTDPADVKELPHAYVFEVNMRGINPREIKVQVEDNNLLVICGEHKHEEETKEKEGSAGAKYLRMERWMGRFLRMFLLPENANTEAISAKCKDGVLTVTIEKVPPPEPKKPWTVEVQVAIGLL